MVTLTSIVDSIQNVLQDEAYTIPFLIDEINGAVQSIAAGMRLSNGQISPPLPDLYTYSTVITGAGWFVPLPEDYQRNIFNILDSGLNKVPPPRGGDYYSFTRFMQQVKKPDLSEIGNLYVICVKGRKLFYQGIPAVPETIGLHYYRKPARLDLDGDTVDAFETFDHLTNDLLKHYVCAGIMGEKIEDGQDNKGIGTKYHTNMFMEAMMAMVDFIGIDSGPIYYGGDGFEDRGACD